MTEPIKATQPTREESKAAVQAKLPITIILQTPEDVDFYVNNFVGRETQNEPTMAVTLLASLASKSLRQSIWDFYTKENVHIPESFKSLINHLFS